MPYKVFTDFHHAGLLNSLILLFEKRLGGEVYRPIGMEWFDQGFWKVYDHPATVQQFLGIGGATPDGSAKLNEVVGYKYPNTNMPPVFLCQDIDSGQTNKAVTFEGFMSMPFDIVIASIPQHIEPFKRLCQLHPNKPKLIFQIGNAWTIEAGLAPNIMASAIINDVPPNINFISYHQEFDLKKFHYPYDDDQPGKHITSFVNCFNIEPHFAKDWQLFQDLEKLMPDWDFKSYGGQCRDGSCNGSQEVADAIDRARFVWHTKAGGDGYGHIIHNAAAMGKPMIVKKSYYVGKFGEKLMIDGKTCIDIDGIGFEDIKQKIDFYSEPERYMDMCAATHYNFTEVCNFDEEEKALRLFLNRLL